MATHLAKLQVALRYSSGHHRREIARQIAEIENAAVVEGWTGPTTIRWCAWCGVTISANHAGQFCSAKCEAEDAADAKVNPR